MPKKSFRVLGVSFLPETLVSVSEKVREAWKNGTRLRIATVNPEFLVTAHADPRFRENLQAAEVRVVDGVGLWLAVFFLGFSGKRLTGVRLTEHLLALASKENKKVLVVLPVSGLSTPEKVKQVLSEKYPRLLLEVIATEKNGPLPSDVSAQLFLFAHGAPEQEYLAESVREGVAIGIGGAIDFLTGVQKRAPKVFQALGLEWLYRVTKEPWRLRRIMRAVIIFPLIFIGERLLILGKVRLLQ